MISIPTIRAIIVLVLVALAQAPLASAADHPVDFASQIQPILSENCFHCHGPDSAERKAELRLDTREGILADLGGYAAVSPGSLDKSALVARIEAHGTDDLMPPGDSNRSLDPAEIDLLKKWIAGGAPWAEHWAFVPPQRPALPAVSDPDWCRNPIDRFILARLDAGKLTPSPPAAPHVLQRRLHLDLTGLPPAPGARGAPSGIENPASTIESLLASPHYGERMALPWLDAARYADSNGFQQDGDRHQWPWRDWVVRAYNDNMPFDQFTIEQLAGDLLPDPTGDQFVATAFNRNHMLNGEGGAIKEEQQVNYVVDRVDTTATVWLGLTMACAQCHDHKYDPITQREFYEFYAFFNNIPESGGVDRRSRGGCDLGNMRSVQYSRPWHEMPTGEQLAVRAETRAAVRDLTARLKPDAEAIEQAQLAWEKTIPEEKIREWRGSFPQRVALALRTLPADRRPAELKYVRDYFLTQGPHENDTWRETTRELNRQEALQKQNEDDIIAVMIMEELPPDKARKTHILERGDYLQPRDEVSAGTPAFLPPLPKDAGAGRLALANWLVSPDHPLTARVTVNRLWQQFFGAGLVSTPEDFGVQGARPSHPDLLDWLAVDFMESGWNVKRLVRLIVNSNTYRQSSRATPALLARDPENRLLARGPRFRLPSLLLRDQALAVSGLLLDDIGGPPVYPHQPEGLWADFSFDKITYPHPDADAHLHRRSLYTFWRRTVAPPNMFDSSARQVCTVKTHRTNTPLQALTLLNDPTFVEAARALASRATREAGPARGQQLARAFTLAASRQPDARELDILTASYDRALREHKENTRAALTQVAQIILNLDEVLTKE